MPKLTVYVDSKPVDFDLHEDDLTSAACELEKLEYQVNPAFPQILIEGNQVSRWDKIILIRCTIEASFLFSIFLQQCRIQLWSKAHLQSLLNKAPVQRPLNKASPSLPRQMSQKTSQQDPQLNHCDQPSNHTHPP